MKTLQHWMHTGFMLCFFSIALFFSSCTNCRWVEDCRCEDGGYWDCSSTENPAEPIVQTPDIDVSIKGDRQGSNYTRTIFNILIKNNGNAAANNLKYTLSIKRWSGERAVVDESKEGISIPALGSLTIDKSLSERMAITGYGIYLVNVDVSYTDAQGKTYSASGFLDY